MRPLGLRGVPRRGPPPSGPCSSPGCDRPAQLRGLCSRCYSWLEASRAKARLQGIREARRNKKAKPPDGAEPLPSMGSGVRLHLCPDYEGCLAYADAKRWVGFDCRACPRASRAKELHADEVVRAAVRRKSA